MLPLRWSRQGRIHLQVHISWHWCPPAAVTSLRTSLAVRNSRSRSLRRRGSSSCSRSSYHGADLD
eukprot:9474833-Pyramimonas_sp.AAC.1